MKTRRTYHCLLLALLSLVLAFTGLAAAACTDDVAEGPETGVYYCDADGAEYTLSLHDGNRFDFAVAGKTGAGKYVLEGEKLTLTFEGEKLTLEATAQGDIAEAGAFVLSYNGATYTLLRKVEYTVQFSADGKTVSTATVVNGRTVAEPAAPEKAGQVFVGWYSDSACKTSYSFTAPVRGNMTLYALFVEPLVPEFRVKLDIGGGLYLEETETVGGRLYRLPEPETGREFAGWWTSHDEDANKLTAKYEGQQIFENTTLYAVYKTDAPLVSVNEKGVTWTADGVNNSYAVLITAPDGTTAGGTVGTANFDYDFASKPEGEYTAAVTLNGKTTTAYYKNKALSRVSVFEVKGSVLLFNAVANATQYLLSVECANPDHNHAEPIPLNGQTTYDFSRCGMSEDGITFTVTARAAGYLDSVSAPFVFERTLEEAEDVSVSSETETVSWREVAEATGYRVIVRTGGGELFNGVVKESSYDLKYYPAGDYEISVSPCADSWNSPKATVVQYRKTSIATPSNLRVEGYKIVWDEVAEATGYEVVVGSETHTVSAAELELPVEAGQTSYAIKVRALAQNGNNSLFSDVINMTGGQMNDSLAYRAGVATWDAVFGAEAYLVKVNEGEPERVSGTSAEITLTRRGTNVISVCAVIGGNPSAEWASIQVEAREVFFEGGNGSSPAPRYFASGDPVRLPQAEREGYTLGGWFTQSADGERFSEGTLMGESDLTLYAGWDPIKITLTLVAERGTFDGTATQTTVEIDYGSFFHLPIPQADDSLKTFVGWYAEANRIGTRYTDANGDSLLAWQSLNGRTLYAAWGDIFSFSHINGGWAVSKGDEINFVREIVIPATHSENGGAEEYVISVSDFSGCTSLRKLSIPETIKYIDVGTTGAAFSGCTSLTEIEIYKVDGYRDDVIFEVRDNLILRHNTTAMDGNLELYFVPESRSGYLRIPDGVEVINDKVFLKATKITEIEIPASVIRVGIQAFSALTNNLQKVTFLEAEGERGSLELGTQAFFGCTNLYEVTLPSEMVGFDADVFKDCTALRVINVAGTGGEYSSMQNMLTRTVSDGKEIVFAPAGISGDLRLSGFVSVGDRAFEAVTGLTRVIVPGTVQRIGASAFDGVKAIERIVFEGTEYDSPLSIGERAFYDLKALTELVLPRNLVRLEKNAFGGCSALTEVRVESGAFGINFEQGAFASQSGTTYITKVVLGANVPSFDLGAAFGGKVEEIVVEGDNPNFEADEEGVLYSKGRTAILYYPAAKEGPFVVPETVEQIGDSTFEDRILLTEITIGKNVTYLGARAFEGCKELSRVTFVDGGNGALTIGDRAFYDCVLIETVDLPKRTQSIGTSAFQGCSQLRSVTLPEGLEEIGATAFKSSGLTSVAFPSTLKSFDLGGSRDFNIFESCRSLSVLTVADGNANFYAEDNVLYGKTNGVVTDLIYAPTSSGGTDGTVRVPDTVKTVWTHVFANNTNIRRLLFADEAVNGLEIEKEAFYYCLWMEEVKLPRGLTTIATNVFAYCSALTTVTIPNTVSSIAVDAFYRCTSLAHINFETGNVENELVLENYTSQYGNDAHGVFYGSTSLVEITLPERTTQIGTGAFAGCTSLKTVNIPSTVKAIERYAFYRLNIREVNIAANSELESIDYQAFAYSGIESINLPQSLRTIGAYAFQHCPNLTEIVLPQGLELIGTYAFAYTPIEELVIPASVISIGDRLDGGNDGYTFAYNSALRSVRVEDNSALKTFYYGGAFANCTNLKTVDFGQNSSLEELSTHFIQGTQVEAIVIPASVVKIGYNTFEGATKLASVTWENESESKLETIERNAFRRTALKEFRFPNGAAESITTAENLFAGCSQLETIYISKTVSTLDKALMGCASLKTIVVDPDNKNFKADGELPILYNAEGDTIRLVFGNMGDEVMDIPEGIVTIGASAFANRTDLVAVIIPATVTTIDDYAFLNCIHLQSVTFAEGSNLQTVGQYAFINCYELETINFENCSKLTTFESPSNTIEYTTFAYCYALNHVDLSKTQVETLPQGMFYGCSSLDDIKLPSTLKNIKRGAFRGTALKEIDWSDCTNLEVLGGQYNNAVTTASSASSVFEGCEQLVSVKLPAILRMGSSTFASCPNLKEVTIDVSKLTLFGNNLFKDCANLTTVNLTGNASFTTLGNNAFQNCTSLKTIDLPDSLTFLGTGTFRGSGIETIDMSRLTKLTQIQEKEAASTNLNGSVYTFAECTKLTKVVLPSSCKTIGAYAFNGCTQLSDINLDNVTFVGVQAFAHCGFKSLTIPAVTQSSNCGNGTFRDNAELTEVNFSASCTYVGQNMFNGCLALERVTFPATIKTFGANSFENCTALHEVQFAENFAATTLGTYTFKGCTALEHFETPASVTNLGNYMFQNAGLLTFTVPATVTTLGTYLFDGCTNLSHVEFAQGFKGTALGNYMFRGCTGLKTIEIPQTITNIGTYTFQNSGLTRIDLSALNLVRIGATANVGSTTNGYTFAGCTDLTEVLLPSTVTQIGGYTFSGCVSLQSFDFSNIEIIGQHAFEGSGLNSVSLPAALTNIYTAAFSNIEPLANITVNRNNANYYSKDGMLFDAADMLVAYPGGLKIDELTITATAINNYALSGATFTTLTIEGLVSAGQYAFYGVTADTVVLPDTLTEILSNAFNGANIRYIEIPASVETIATSAFTKSGIEEAVFHTPNLFYYSANGVSVYAASSLFDGSEKLRSVTLAEGTTSIPASAFATTPALETVHLPESLTEIGSSAFKNSGIREFELKEGIVTIGSSAFQGSLISKLNIPSTVTSIGAGAFMDMVDLNSLTFTEGDTPLTFATAAATTGPFAGSGLTSITLPARLTVISDYMFSGATSLVEIHSKNGPTAINQYAFNGATALKTVEIPETVTTIGQYAFTGSGIENIIIPDTVTTFGSYVFRNCAQLQTVKLPASVTEIGGYMFANCVNLKSFEFGENVTSISSDAFLGCTSLSELYIPATVVACATSAFDGFTSDQTIYFEASELEIYSWWWTNYGNTWRNNCEANLVFDHTKA